MFRRLRNYIKHWRQLLKNMDELLSRTDEMQKRLKDVSIRAHDTQDRAYDILARTQDVQDRVYDTLSCTGESRDRIYDIIRQMRENNAQRDMMYWALYKEEGETVREAQLRFFSGLPKAEGNRRMLQEYLTYLMKQIDDVCRENDIEYWMDYGTLLGAYRHEGFVPWDDDVDLGMLRADAEKFIEVAAGDDRVQTWCTWKNIGDGNGLHKVLRVRNGSDSEGVTPFIDIFFYDYCDRDEDSRNVRTSYKSRMRDMSSELPMAEIEIYRHSDEEAETLRIFDEAIGPIMTEANETLGVTDKPADYIVFGTDNLPAPERIQVTERTDAMFPTVKLKFEDYEFSAPHNYEEYLNHEYENILSLPNDILSHFVHYDVKETTEELEKLHDEFCNTMED